MVKQRSDIIKISVLLISSVLIALLLLEVALRAVGYSYSPLRIVANSNDARFKHSYQDRHFVYDPDLIWRPKKSRVFNAQGYLGKELSVNKSGNEYRIFAIGDSNTLGWYGQDSWALYLQELVTNRDKAVYVINAGVYGYTSYQGEKRFEETLALKPDMVLICFGANDQHMVAVSDADFNRTVLSTYKRLLYKFKVGQVLIAFLETFVEKRESTKDQLVHRVSIEEYKKNLIRIIEVSKKNNITCVLLTRPVLGESADKLSWKHYAPDYREATIAVAGDYNVPVIDLYSYFKDQDQYFMDDGHFNEKGHRLAAKVIYDQIQPLLTGSGSK
ncbi:MAG TPA: SGNH/GDSL hydrolase family protein [Syntrophorhabdales bacterium]|nr:SGNH/GDSL hydrolase family protein [Syntrophorhabdales bacterium]